MLPKSKRQSTEAFTEIIEKGRSFHSPFLILRVLPHAGDSKFSVSVPKKVAKLATDRNKRRRQVYSAISKLEYKPNFRVIVILKAESKNLTFSDLQNEIKQVFVKSGLLK